MIGRIEAAVRQRRVAGDDVAIQKRLQRQIFCLAAFARFRRIVEQRNHAQCAGLGFDARTNLAHADNADGFAAQLESVFRGKMQPGRGHVFGDRIGVAAGGRGEPDALARQPRLIHVIRAGGRRADKPHPGSGQQPRVDFRDGTHEEQARSFQTFALDRPPVNQFHFAQAAKRFASVRHVFVGYDF
ncbi:MAG: hypothetical protein BWZ10_03113 [candidate division BRC1 bacterium ADurb.BinA364]|nr:MAG: hypothetical protein BWZ10_03113 [candidate division BRC1 bacterium ADurb.BinA364]